MLHDNWYTWQVQLQFFPQDNALIWWLDASILSAFGMIAIWIVFELIKGKGR